MDHPTSKAELMDRIEQTWSSFNAAVAGVNPSLLEISGPDGWSVKDQVAHIAAWERSLIAILTKQSRAEAVGMDEETYGASDTDAINAKIHADTKDLPFAEIQADARRTHDELLRVLEQLTWEDLNQPYSHYQSKHLPENDYIVGAWVAGNTYDHYPEHQEYVERTAAVAR